jgi:mono/diheme cytochrome c family protein
MAVAFDRVDRMDPDTVAIQMMGEGMMPHMMQDMWGGRLPPGIRPEDLPDLGSEGSELLTRYCVQCHNLPSPAIHTAAEWPAVAARMFGRMATMAQRSHHRGMMRRHGMGSIRAPTADEQRELLAYLQQHALRPAEPDGLGPQDTPGLALFRRTCTQCHALPDAALHTADEWPIVVERMRRNMEVMGKPGISDQERDEIVAHLQERVSR